MNGDDAPARLDHRGAEAIAADLLKRLPGYVPGWRPADTGQGWAIIQVYARFLQNLAERLNQAPTKNKLAFLDRLGINLLPAQAARAPVVFQMMPDAGDSRAQTGTRLGAQVPGRSDPLVFETEETVGLAGAKLAEVVMLWPGRNGYADHSQAALGGKPFTLYQPLKPVAQELYLAHDTYLALAGQCTIKLEFELAAPSSEMLDLVWGYWDGTAWRGFKEFSPEDKDGESFDGTLGLTRSGTIRLAADCAKAERTKVNGIEGYWIRGKINKPPSSTAGSQWPLVDTIKISTVIDGYVHRLIVTSSPEQLPVQGELYVNTLKYPTGRYAHTVAELWGSGGFYSKQEVDNTQQLDWHSLAAGSYRLCIFIPGYDLLEHRFTLSAIDGARFDIDQVYATIQLDYAYSDSQQIDLSKAFYPFGQQPQPGSAFYFASKEVFSKSGASVTLVVKDAMTPPELSDISPVEGDPKLTWEYWNGEDWQTLPGISDPDASAELRGSGDLTFTVPENIVQHKVNGQDGMWIRVRLVSGSFGRIHTVEWQAGYQELKNPNGTTKYELIKNTLNYFETVPPALAQIYMGYLYHSPKSPPQQCLTYNDFQWEDHAEDAAWRGAAFSPFRPIEDTTPALYLGFDRPLPADQINIYLDIEEAAGETAGPPLRWEYWGGAAWLPLSVQDETANLARPGMIRIIWPGVPALPSAALIQAAGSRVLLAGDREAARFQSGDRVYLHQNDSGELAIVDAIHGSSMMLKAPLGQKYAGGTIGIAGLARFGTPRTWIRVRGQGDNAPIQSKVNGIYLNATWAAQVQTLNEEFLGSSIAQPGHSFFFRQIPVLEGEWIEVRELDGPRANVEWPILAAELFGKDTRLVGELEERLEREALPDDIIQGNLRLKRNRSKQVTQAWVRWQERPNLFFSGPDDRHYMIERGHGRLIFGDNRHGKIPPSGSNNICARRYRSGGGVVGNVPAGAISQLLGAVPLVQRVTNPRMAEGGADGEPTQAVLARGPQTIRHRRQAISLADYEALAREASPAVAVARALPVTHPSGRPAPGWVRLIIIPQSQEPQPQPSFELRRQVQQFLAARTPAAVASQVTVAGPNYLPVGVDAVVVPVNPQDAGRVRDQVCLALNHFLHPLMGGPDGLGWPFGRDVYLSDVAAVLEAIEGVDYITSINLLLAGTPLGERINIPPDRIVVAGSLRITLTGAER